MNPTVKGNFLTQYHPYVYLGGSLIALLGLSLMAGAAHPGSFLTDNTLSDFSFQRLIFRHQQVDCGAVGQMIGVIGLRVQELEVLRYVF